MDPSSLTTVHLLNSLRLIKYWQILHRPYMLFGINPADQFDRRPWMEDGANSEQTFEQWPRQY